MYRGTGLRGGISPCRHFFSTDNSIDTLGVTVVGNVLLLYVMKCILLFSPQSEKKKMGGNTEITVLEFLLAPERKKSTKKFQIEFESKQKEIGVCVCALIKLHINHTIRPVILCHSH